MRTLALVIAKDLLLLWRDRAALLFLCVAPIAVITVAGFSLASLYGADPTGQMAYQLPLADEDAGALGRRLAEQMAAEPALVLQRVPTREAAAALVREKKAGTALVIPAGTEQALREGRSASLLLYVDPVKYLERLNVRIRLLELRDRIAREEAGAARATVTAQRAALERNLGALRTAEQEIRARLDAAAHDADEARQTIEARVRDAATARETRVRAALERALGAARNEAQATIDARVADWRAALQAYAEELAASRTAFEAWLLELERRAGSHAAEIPPPPIFPDPPPALAALLQGGDGLVLPAPAPLPELSGESLRLGLPRFSLPAARSLDLPQLALPELPGAPGTLDIEEISLDGGKTSVNTFDQNVPGFSVTFLLLGMLLGVSLGLLDEREWGTLDRLRAMPVGISAVLGGKLASRFLVGCAQMVLLLTVGWLAFGVSLGPAPWLLLLPIVGIVFAATAFGLIIAAVAPGRDTVLPVGSIVIVTMAAVGGCWWPIDLEPRWMRQAALAFPTTWAMEAFNDLMIRRRGLEAALRPTGVLLAYGGLYLALGLALFRAKLRRVGA
jgi:ABC-type multidrug transport system permease subunit